MESFAVERSTAEMAGKKCGVCGDELDQFPMELLLGSHVGLVDVCYFFGSVALNPSTVGRQRVDGNVAAANQKTPLSLLTA